MFPISLTVRGKKEMRNRYFFVDSLRDFSGRCQTILWDEKQTVDMIKVAMRENPGAKLSHPFSVARDFIIRMRISFWLIIEFNGVRKRSRYRARSCGGSQ